jgi:hypothetical protein
MEKGAGPTQAMAKRAPNFVGIEKWWKDAVDSTEDSQYIGIFLYLCDFSPLFRFLLLTILLFARIE